MTRRVFTLLPLLLLAGLALSGCRKVDVQVYAYGIEPERVRVEVEELSAQSAEALSERARQPDVDGAALLDEASCGGPCRAVLVTLFIENDGKEPLPPPVARISSPEGRPARLPVAFRALEISPGRIGRLRLLAALWPEERALDVRLSGSVRLDVNAGPAASPPRGSTAP